MIPRGSLTRDSEAAARDPEGAIVKIGIIVGTGMNDLAKGLEWAEVSTPFGYTVTATIQFGGREVVVVRRHGPGLNVPPHLINYRANLWAMRDAGVKPVLATAAVGSLRRPIKPSTLAIVRDFIDFSKRGNLTIYDTPGERLRHIDLSRPYCPLLSSVIEQAAAEIGVELGPRVVYVCVDGPRYETPAEVKMFAKMGGDVVGMTSAPEAILSRELDMCYGSLAIVTNYAAAFGEHKLEHDDVAAAAKQLQPTIRAILERAVALIPETGNGCGSVD